MTFEGRFSSNKYRTVLSEDSYSCESLSGESKGTKITGNLDRVDVEPDFLEEVTDLRFFGWLFLAMYFVMSFLVIIMHGRWDVVGLVFTPMVLLPSVAMIRFFKWTYRNRIFFTTAGGQAFGISEDDWSNEELQEQIRSLIKREHSN